MFDKNSTLNKWLWKWHVIAGLITLPFMILLSITGTIYLFKENVNQQLYQEAMFVNAPTKQLSSSNPTTLPLSQQLASAQTFAKGSIASVSLPTQANQATKFGASIKGGGRASNNIYVNPYTAEVTGQLNQKDTLMYKVRKLHGELLLSQPGTLVVEIVASWFIVLIVSGLYVWWPKKGTGMAGVLTIRTQRGRRIFWRDIHSVLGFWLSIFMLIILAGGMPWTDVFGSQLKWVQQQTDTGYPAHWRSTKGLQTSTATNTSTQITIDDVAKIAQQKELLGVVTIKLPTEKANLYTITNRSLWLDDQQVIHIDSFTGETIKALNWQDVGVLMNLRQIFMRLHQGEYGLPNWLGILMVGLLFTLTNIAGLISYLARKPEGLWGIPKVPASFKTGKVLVIGIIGLGVIFPMFGLSLLVIILWQLKGKFFASKTKVVTE